MPEPPKPQPKRKQTRRSPTSSEPRQARPALSAALDARIWELRQHCRTQSQIARELGIDQSTVSRALQRIQEPILRELTEDVARLKACQTAQLELILSEAVRGWQRSQQALETTHTRTRQLGDAALPETVTDTTKKGQAGAPEMLARAMDALAAIRKIWGLEAQPEALERTATEPADEVESILAQVLELKTKPKAPPCPPKAPPRKRPKK